MLRRKQRDRPHQPAPFSRTRPSSSPYETLETTASGATNLCIDNADSTIGPPYYGDPALLVPVAPDIDGEPVSSKGPDIGAYEIQS